MKPITWRFLKSFDSKFDYEHFLFKNGKCSTKRSQKTRCMMCDVNTESHDMQYRLIHCSSDACHSTYDEACKFVYKTTQCFKEKK